MTEMVDRDKTDCFNNGSSSLMGLFLAKNTGARKWSKQQWHPFIKYSDTVFVHETMHCTCKVLIKPFDLWPESLSYGNIAWILINEVKPFGDCNAFIWPIVLQLCYMCDVLGVLYV